MLQLLGEVFVEAIKHLFPVELPLSNVIQGLLHSGGKVIVHQVGKVFHQTFTDNFTHLLGVETAVFHFHITTILDGGNNSGISRGTTYAALFQFFNQRGFAVTCRWLGKVLFGIQLFQIQFIALRQIWQSDFFFILAFDRRLYRVQPSNFRVRPLAFSSNSPALTVSRVASY